MNDHDPDKQLEDALHRLRPRTASGRIRQRLFAAESLAAVERAAQPHWSALLMRIAFSLLVLGSAVFFLLPERTSEVREIAPLPPPPGRNTTGPVIAARLPAGMKAFTPVETNRLILSSQPIGTMTGPDEMPLELRRVRWLDYSRSHSPDGDLLVIGYETEQIIPFALTIH